MNFALPATDKLFKLETIRIELPIFYQYGLPPDVAGKSQSSGPKKIIDAESVKRLLSFFTGFMPKQPSVFWMKSNRPCKSLSTTSRFARKLNEFSGF